MTLVLSSNKKAELGAAGGPVPPDGAESSPRLRVGIINIMPRAEAYEPYVLRPIARARQPVEPVWIRLESHTSTSTDAEHVRRLYVPFGEAIGRGRLDGLILTGAPVEHLPFEQVLYWYELESILSYARRSITSTLGLCWGGLALGKVLGLEKTTFPKKLFGVFPNRSLSPGHVITGDFDDVFFCAHSRHSGVADEVLEAARDAKIVTLLSHGEKTGYSLFESTDHRFVAHLGHPEYEPDRLVHEWRRDAELGRTDVETPENFDVASPLHVWRSHANELFDRWLTYLAEGARDERATSRGPERAVR